MKRGWMRTAGFVLAVTVLTLAAGTDVAMAQETEEKQRQEQQKQAEQQQLKAQAEYEKARQAEHQAQAAQEARRAYERVIVSQAGGGSYLGVRIAEVDDEAASRLGMSDPHGVLVSEVVEDTPAAEAGLQADDVLVSWNGTRLESIAQLQRQMKETPAGRSVRFGVFRDGREQQIAVTLAESSSNLAWVGAPEALARIEEMQPHLEDMQIHIREMEPQLEELRARLKEEQGRVRVFTPEGEGAYSVIIGGRGRMGVSLQSLGDQMAEYFGVDGGALITNVREDSPAAAAGLKAGDVIVQIAGETVEGPGDASRLVGDREPGPVDVRVMRDGQERTITVQLDEKQSNVWCSEDGECEEWAEQLRGFAQDFSTEFTDEFATEFSNNWTEWAAEYSDNWHAWAEEHSGDWEEWAAEYSDQWKDWAEHMKEWAAEWKHEYGDDGTGHVEIEPGMLQSFRVAPSAGGRIVVSPNVRALRVAPNVRVRTVTPQTLRLRSAPNIRIQRAPHIEVGVLEI